MFGKFKRFIKKHISPKYILYKILKISFWGAMNIWGPGAIISSIGMHGLIGTGIIAHSIPYII